MKKFALAALGIFLIATVGCDGGAKDGGAKDGAAKDGAARDGGAKDGAAKKMGASPVLGGAAATLAAFDAAPPVIADSPFKEGEMLPEIAGVDTAGGRFKISDYRGKVVMIDFSGKW